MTSGIRSKSWLLLLLITIITFKALKDSLRSIMQQFFQPRDGKPMTYMSKVTDHDILSDRPVFTNLQ